MNYIQAFINCDLPGMRQIEYDTGSGYTAATISGFLCFKDYVAALSAELPNGWSMAYSESFDAVVVTAGTGAIQLRFESQSMANVLGSASTETTSRTITFRLGSSPDGVVPAPHLHYANPISGNKPRLRTFRHGRAHSFSFGSAVNYKVTARTSEANADRLQSGPLSTGKVRLGAYTAAAAYSSSNLGGYLDGYIRQQGSLSYLNESTETTLESTFELVASTTAHDDDAALSDEFFGHLERGYGINYALTIEGVPFRFIEHPTGFSAGDYTDSATLVVDESQSAHYKIDRYKGVVAASGLTFGVLDPENELGLFTRASVLNPIASAVAYNDTTVTLSNDSDSFGASGTVFLGKECLSFSGNTGPSGTPANTLQNITRPYGPGYDYGEKTSAKFCTVTNKKRVWDGCEVALHAILVDPYGAPVGSSYSDDYVRKIFTGEIDGVPGYDNGVWVMATRDLMRRLTKKIGTGASAKTSPRASQESLALQNAAYNDASSIYVRTRAADTLIVKVHTDAGQGQISKGEYEYTLSDDLPSFHTLYEGIDQLLNIALNQIALLASNPLSHSVEITHLAGEYTIDEHGTPSVAFTVKQLSGTNIVTLATLEFLPKLNVDAPEWMPSGLTLYSGSSSGEDGGTLYLADIPNFSGKTVTNIVAKRPPNAEQALGTFEDSGFCLLAGDNEVGEMIRYEEYDDSTLQSLGLVVFKNCVRNLIGQPVNVFRGAREIQQAIRQGDQDTAANATLGSFALNLLESSGNELERGAFDTFPAGFGYGLKASTHVLEGTSSYVNVDKSIAGPLNTTADLIVTGGASFQDYFGGVAAAFGLCFAWVRDGSALKIGLVRTQPAGNQVEFTITDNDLVAGDSVSTVKVAAGPNEVIVEQAQNPLVNAKSQYTYRVIEDMLARGTVSQKLTLYGMQESQFFVFAGNIAASLVNSGSNDVAYKLKVRPNRDYLAGQAVGLSLTHPGVYDWKNDAAGLSDVGRIMEVRRDLGTGECELTVMTSATTYFGPLCPVAVVSASATVGGNTVLTVSDASLWQAGESIYVYNPGTSIGEERQVAAINLTSNTVTISGLLSFAITANYTTASYASDDYANLSERQDAYTHVADGSAYL